MPKGSNFSGGCFCLSVLLDLFPEVGLVIGLSGFFRSPWNRPVIGMENLFLEIAGFESESGLIMGDFLVAAALVWDRCRYYFELVGSFQVDPQ
jgi:hypothetical protein